MTGDGSPESRGSGARARARRWLRDRLDETPSALGSAVVRAMEELPPAGEEEQPWDAMARGALRQLEATRAEADDRQAALQLLAADALLTYAFQCAAEEDGDLGEMAERWGPRGGLGEALDRALGADEAEGADPTREVT